MTTPRTAELEALDSLGNGLRVVYRWKGDRFGHTIYGIHQGKSQPVIKSREGTPAETWPLSPPLQELHVHDHEDGSQALLLTGMAGKSHWSVSVEANDGVLNFDLAVRLKEQPPQLTACYRVVEGGKWTDMGASSAAITDSNHAVSITGASPQDRPEKADSEVLQIQMLGGRPEVRLFQPMRSLPANLPATYQWSYAIGIQA